jgi:hypothetical protein
LYFEGVDWIHLAKNSFQWRVLVIMAMDLLFRKVGEFLDHVSDDYTLKKDSASWSWFDVVVSFANSIAVLCAIYFMSAVVFSSTVEPRRGASSGCV